MEGGGATKMLSYSKQGKGAWFRAAAHIPVILTYTDIVLSGG